MKLDDDALEFMAHTLQVFTQVELSVEERTAAFTLLRALPQDTLIKDLITAASPEEVARRGLPASIAETLKPLLSRLELSLPYAGRFASLLEAEQT